MGPREGGGGGRGGHDRARVLALEHDAAQRLEGRAALLRVQPQRHERDFLARLAQRGEEKTDLAMRIPVFHDTTACKEWIAPGTKKQTGLSFRLEVHRLVQRKAEKQDVHSRICLERPTHLLLQFCGVPTACHEHQLHVAEFCAVKVRDVILNLDLIVEARNSAMKAAEKHGSLHLASDDEGGAGEPTAEGQAPLDF